MHERGAIRNRAFASQIKDFRGLRFGNITPTDIDGFIEFGDRLFVFIEGKFGGASLSFGQRLAIERLVDACHNPPRRYSTAFIVDHDTTEGDVDYASATIRAYRWFGKWMNPLQKGMTLKAGVDRMIALSNRANLRVVQGGK